jgi:hypothetical protein
MPIPGNSYQGYRFMYDINAQEFQAIHVSAELPQQPSSN